MTKKLPSVKIFAPCKEIDRLHYGWARITANKNTDPVGIGREKDDGDLPEKNIRKNGFLLKDDRDFAMNQSISPSLYPCPSVLQTINFFVRREDFLR